MFNKVYINTVYVRYGTQHRSTQHIQSTSNQFGHHNIGNIDPKFKIYAKYIKWKYNWLSFGKKSTGSQWLIYWERNMERLPLKACLCVCFFFFFSFSFFNGMDYGVYLWWFFEYMMLRKTFFSLLKSGKRFSFPFYWLAFSTIPNVRKRFSFEQNKSLKCYILLA